MYKMHLMFNMYLMVKIRRSLGYSFHQNRKRLTLTRITPCFSTSLNRFQRVGLHHLALKMDLIREDNV